MSSNRKARLAAGMMAAFMAASLSAPGAALAKPSSLEVGGSVAGKAKAPIAQTAKKAGLGKEAGAVEKAVGKKGGDGAKKAPAKKGKAAKKAPAKKAPAKKAPAKGKGGLVGEVEGLVKDLTKRAGR